MSKLLPSGHTFQVMEGDEADQLNKNYFLYNDGVLKVNPGNYTLVPHFTKYASKIYNLEVRPTDIFVLTFPKSGTTWVQEIVWNLVHNPDLDNPDALIVVDARFRYYESDMIRDLTGALPLNPNGVMMKKVLAMNPDKEGLENRLSVNLVAFDPDPRMLKNHLPFCLLSQDIFQSCKSIYVARDPRDVIISMYHFCRLHNLFGFRGTLDEILDDFINDNIIYGPYWSHIKAAWDKRNDPNFCFMFYEDMIEDIVSQVKKVDQFLGTHRNEEQIQNIVHHTSFHQMKETWKDNPPTSGKSSLFNKEILKTDGGFFRKGQSGDWKNTFTASQVEKVNKWMAKNLVNFGYDFRYKV